MYLARLYAYSIASGAHDVLGTEMKNCRIATGYHSFSNRFRSLLGKRALTPIIMKNLISLFILAIVLVFTSCGKEDLPQPRNIDVYTTETFDLETDEDQTAIQSNNNLAALITSVEVHTISSTMSGGELLVDFSSTYDFTGVELESSQVLVFTDANGNESNLTFLVNDYNYDNNVLSVDFDLAAHSLSGLTLKNLQYIIISDEIIN